MTKSRQNHNSAEQHPLTAIFEARDLKNGLCIEVKGPQEDQGKHEMEIWQMR